MFNKILIANRGEIATRIIRACKEMGIKSAVIYTEEDSTALYIKKADEAYLVSPGPIEAYLNIHRIVDLALKINADAIHPGYGFISENPKMAELCEKRGIVFIGPSSEAIELMGDKLKAREFMKKHDISIVDGSDEPIKSATDAVKWGKIIGYPLIIKASGGGGGRGLRIANTEKELLRYFKLAMSEAEKFFGNSEIFVERYIHKSHHIEFQILADHHENVIHLGERDCSIQRRHQKVIEIAPSLILGEQKRKEIGRVAIKIAKLVNYTNAGTIEFLVDSNMRYFFMEMNTRLQVEHPVTEAITGIDIVKKQIEIAAGMELNLKQKDVKINGNAIECRLIAEDPKNNFLPNGGRITAYYSPGGIGVRIDGAVYKDYVVPDYYDPLLAKMTVRGETWDEVVNRTRRALEEFVIRGIKTNIPYLLAIVSSDDFKKGYIDTEFINEHQELLGYEYQKDPMDIVIAIASVIAMHEGM
ncbi:MAG: acetyl-CoA carboxylase biotin carboxylase subunit [Deltaproteobacteria bacterium]|nr:acetyl-CoA carboxylase biotin carboxylase subunit [Deltaproteobacteria bacterium]MCL5791921.1 acetyl-CoA carboxylase biotin carboxylase subunit [Deltaproteobacteria bacterium]